MKAARIATLLVLPLLGGCVTGKFVYTPPTERAATLNSIEIARPIDGVWATAIPALGRHFFVVNTIDRSSGFVNLSYSGGPEQFVDCGEISSTVANAAGERTYSFPASRSSQYYERTADGRLFQIDRRASLDGRVNLIFEAIGPNRTRVTITTRYVFTRESQVTTVGTGISRSLRDSISFNTNQSGRFQPDLRSVAVTCYATGKLEADLLNLLR